MNYQRDGIRISIDPALQSACNAYALRVQADVPAEPGENPYPALRRAAVRTAANILIRRLLQELALPFSVFTPDPLRRRPDFLLAVNGRPWTLLEITNAGQSIPERLPAYLPSRTIVVAFRELGEWQNTHAQVQKTSLGGLPVDLVLGLKRKFQTGPHHLALEAVPAEPHPFLVQMIGRRSDGDLDTIQLRICPGELILLPTGWMEIIFLRTRVLPRGNLVLTGPNGLVLRRIRPFQWKNIWRRDAGIHFLGWARLGEIRPGRSVESAGWKPLEAWRGDREMPRIKS